MRHRYEKCQKRERGLISSVKMKLNKKGFFSEDEIKQKRLIRIRMELGTMVGIRIELGTMAGMYT